MVSEGELKENRVYYRCKKCGKIWAGKFDRCQICLSELEQIRSRDGKIEVVTR